MAHRELLCSGPGRGKTTYCIEEFRDQILRSKGGIESRSFFILPSREHAERIQNLVLGRTVPGLFNAHILTINDFAGKVSGLLPVSRPSDAVRQRIVREILQDANAFSYFSDVLDCEGFAGLLVDTIKEFKSALLSIEVFEKLSQSLIKKEPGFRLKFKDLTIFLKRYEAALEELGLREVEDDIAEFVGGKTIFQDAELIIFDGFYYFTRAQRALIEWVSEKSARTLVTLTLSENSPDRKALFEYPERTRIFLKDIGFKEKQGFFGKNHRTAEASLVHLERNIFLEEPALYEKDGSGITIFEAPSARTEIEMIAREIKKIYREEDVHLSDICVISRSIKEYEGLIEALFSKLEIPIHVHERKKLIEHSFALTFRRFLNLALEDWKREDLFYVMKSGYLSGNAGISDVLALETAALKENITDGRDNWQELTARGELSGIGRVFLGMILDWERKLAAAENPRALQKQLLGILDHFRVKPDLENEDPEGRIDAQVFMSVRALIMNIQKNHKASSQGEFSSGSILKELVSALESDLFSLKPKGRNRVQVYDVVMAMPKEYKVVFIAGLLEKKFPQSSFEDALLKDHERRIINKNETFLEERLARIAGERYFFYMAATRAKERLYLTYPLYDLEGRQALPSFFIEETNKCFNGKLRIVKKDLDDFLAGPEEWETPQEVSLGLARSLFSGKTGHQRLSEAWKKREDFKGIWEYGLSSDAAVLTDDRIKKIFSGIKGPFSATRLETYATCAFKYFAGQSLHLNESSDNHEAAEIGKILHGVLEDFYKDLSEAERRGGTFLSDEILVKRKLQDLLIRREEKSSLVNAPPYRRRTLLKLMSGILDLFIAYEKEDLGKRGLVPLHFEFDFGRSKDSSVPCLKIEDKDGDIFIKGQIDRIDKVEGSDKALVIDYKTSERSMKLKERLGLGLELQLPIYLLAVRRLLGLETMAAELRILKSAKSEGFYREEEKGSLGLSSNKSAYSNEEFERLLSEAEEKIRSYVKRLRNGDISVNSKSCKYCSFSSVCRFEPWKLVYEK